jgi:hypothetical protein
LKFLGELRAGPACAGTNQQELTTCAKSKGQHKKKFKKKGAGRPCPGIDPRSAGDRWSPPGSGPTIGGQQPLDAELPATPGCRMSGDQRSGPGCGRATGPQPLVASSPATPGPAGNQRSPDGRGSTPGQGRPGPFFLNFFDASSYTLVNFLLEVWGMGKGFWENGCTVHPFFQASPFTWKCQIFHSS